MGTKAVDSYFANRMDTYRLIRVSSPEGWKKWPTSIQDDLGRFMAGGRVDRIVGVFLNAVLTNGSPIVALSRNDLEDLVESYCQATGTEAFELRSGAKGTSKTLYAAFWAAIDKRMGLAKMILKSSPKRPCVVEVADPEYLAVLKPVTKELRQTVLKAVRPE